MSPELAAGSLAVVDPEVVHWQPLHPHLSVIDISGNSCRNTIAYGSGAPPILVSTLSDIGQRT